MKNRDKYILKKCEYDLLMDIEAATHQCPIATIGGIEFKKRFARCYKFRKTGCNECVQAWLNEEGGVPMNEETKEQTISKEEERPSPLSEAEAFERIMGRPIPKIKLDD